MQRLLFVNLFTVLIGALFALPTLAQEEKVSSLEAAKKISQATGRPIFAVAGRGT